jgi:hypothetical protein
MSVTKLHPNGIPFRGWLVDAEKEHCPHYLYCALGILINSLIDVFLVDLTVRCSIRVVHVIELHAHSEDQEHLAKP